jgi:hypothetical protein
MQIRHVVCTLRDSLQQRMHISCDIPRACLRLSPADLNIYLGVTDRAAQPAPTPHRHTDTVSLYSITFLVIKRCLLNIVLSSTIFTETLFIGALLKQ